MTREDSNSLVGSETSRCESCVENKITELRVRLEEKRETSVGATLLETRRALAGDFRVPRGPRETIPSGTLGGRRERKERRESREKREEREEKRVGRMA